MKKIAQTFIWLSVIGLIALPLMYSYNVIGPEFHEIGGGIVLALFLGHGIASLIAAPKGTKALSYIIDALMVLAFIAVAVSGLFISKLFVIGSAAGSGMPAPEAGLSIWRVLHGPVSILALILLGIHLGLKWSWFKARLGKYVRLPKDIARPVGLAIIVVLLVGGLASFWASGAIGQLATPLLMQSAVQQGGSPSEPSGIGSLLMGAGPGRGEFGGNRPGDGTSRQLRSNLGNPPENLNDAETAPTPPKGAENHQGRDGRGNQSPFIMWLMYSLMLSVPVLVTRGIRVIRSNKKNLTPSDVTDQQIIAEMISAAEEEKLRLLGTADEPTA